MATNRVDGTDTARPRYEDAEFSTTFTSESGQLFRVQLCAEPPLNGPCSFQLTELDADSDSAPIWSQWFATVTDLEHLSPTSDGGWTPQPPLGHVSAIANHEGYEGANTAEKMAAKRGHDV